MLGEGKGGRFQKMSRILAVFWFLPGDGQSLRHVNFKKEKKKRTGDFGYMHFMHTVIFHQHI